MRKHETAALDEVCEIVGGGTPSRTESRYFGGSIPWATPTDVTALSDHDLMETREKITEDGLRESSAKLLPEGAVLLTSRATIGYTAIARRPMATNQGFANFICGPRVLPEYLAHWLPTRKQEMLRHAGGTTFKEISKGALKRFLIPLPPIEEQRRIAAMLDRSARLVKLHKQAAAKTRDLIPALFIEMFGDPLRADIPRFALSELAEVASGLTKGRKLNGTPTRDVPYLRVANVQAGHLDLSEIKTIPATDREITAIKLAAGDVLLTEGGDHDKLGRGALWSGEIEECLHQNHVFRVRPNQNRLQPIYFDKFLQTAEAKLYFLRAAKRTTNLASINMTQLRALPVPVPEQAEQMRFCALATELAEMHRRALGQLAATEELHRSLLAEVFGEA